MSANNAFHQRQPHEFYIDAFGAKGDGQQALVNTVAGSAVINTTPLGAPAAPTVSNSGTGGTILAGVYTVVITYVNRWGESVGSASAATTTTGSTSTITVNAPNPIGNAVGWYAYVTQAGGAAGTATRQQAPGSPTVNQNKLVLTVPPTNTGVTAPGADTTAAQVFTSTAVDGGKNIMINGGLGSPGTPWIDTILSVQSPTQATLSSNGAGQGGNVTVSGAAAVFSTDDRLAIDSCIQAAEAYLAAAGNNIVKIIAGSKIYGLGTGLFQGTNGQGNGIGGYGVNYNCQLRYPNIARVISGEESKIEAHLVGTGASSHTQFWASQVFNFIGTSFVSYSIGPTTADPTYGQQAVIGSPMPGTHNSNNAFGNYKAVLDGIQIVVPGWNNSFGLDLQYAAGCHVYGSCMAFAPSTSSGGGVNPSNSWQGSTFWQNKLGSGLRLPYEGNNDDVVVESWAALGLGHAIDTQGDHVIIQRLATISCNNAVVMNPVGDANTHDLTISQWSIENCNGGLVCVGGGHCTVHIVMDGENSSMTDVSDPGNDLYGTLYWSDGFRNPWIPTVVGAANLNIVNCGLNPGHWGAASGNKPGPPAVPASGTALAASASPYRPAAIVVHTGAGVTVSDITLDGVSTGLTMAASSSLALPLLGSGKLPKLTYAGGAPTWDWWLS